MPYPPYLPSGNCEVLVSVLGISKDTNECIRIRIQFEKSGIGISLFSMYTDDICTST